MILPQFELHRPRSLDEAAELLGRHRHDCDLLAGGSDLLPNYKQRLNPKPHLVSLEHIEELREMSARRIGAMVRLADLVRHGEIRERLPVLAAAASQVASPLVIEQATIGGNLMLDTRCFYFNQTLFWRDSKGYCLKADGDVCLVVPQKEVCYATNSSDLAPVLITLDARLVLRGGQGERVVPLRDFYVHDGIARNQRRADELVTHIEIPERSQRLRADYRKLRIRDAIDFPAMGAAVALRTSAPPGGPRDAAAHSQVLDELHIAIGAVDTTPRAFEELTASFVGRVLDPDTIDDIANSVTSRIKPYNNVPLTPTYRKKMVGVFIRRMMTEMTAPNGAGAA